MHVRTAAAAAAAACACETHVRCRMSVQSVLSSAEGHINIVADFATKAGKVLIVPQSEGRKIEVSQDC